MYKLYSTNVLFHIIIENNLLSQDKCAKLFSPTQILKKIDDAFIQSVFAVQILFSGLFRIRQQLKTFRLKHVFLARKIIRSARYVVIKLPAKYPYKDVNEKCLA